jgi:hypothetical protein
MTKMTEEELLGFLEAEQADAFALYNDLFEYKAGALVRRRTVNYNAKAGAIVGTLNKHTGYLVAHVAGKVRTIHRIVWAMHHGSEPQGQIDHINGDRTDNRIENLRCVTNGVNSQNLRRAKSHNSLGLLGVVACRDKFHARITTDGRKTHLGSFATADAAHAAYIAAKRVMHEGCTI